VKQLLGQHRYGEALKPCVQLHDDFPENSIYVEQLATIYDKLSDLPKAAAMWERYIDQAPTPAEGCPHLTRTYIRMGQFGKSIDAARRCTELEPQNPDLVFELAHAHEISQHVEEAERLYREGAALAPDNDDFRIGLGRLSLRQGKPAEAETVAEAVLRRSPRNSDALLLKGLACWRQGEVAKAKQSLERGVAIAPSDVDYYLLLGRIAESERNRAAALSQYARALELDPANSEALAQKKALEGVAR
jgi:tetratricopeptide (TPR) repeat protein